MTHLAITEDHGDQPATNWGKKVTDAEYDNAEPNGTS